MSVRTADVTGDGGLIVHSKKPYAVLPVDVMVLPHFALNQSQRVALVKQPFIATALVVSRGCLDRIKDSNP